MVNHNKKGEPKMKKLSAYEAMEEASKEAIKSHYPHLAELPEKKRFREKAEMVNYKYSRQHFFPRALGFFIYMTLLLYFSEKYGLVYENIFPVFLSKYVFINLYMSVFCIPLIVVFSRLYSEYAQKYLLPLPMNDKRWKRYIFIVHFYMAVATTLAVGNAVFVTLLQIYWYEV